jgi:vacuolar-type H+-ATPase subunit C/Vma6
MNQKEQIQLAFEIYERMSRLESALWGQYYKQFLEIIMDEEDKKGHLDDVLPDDVF